jgi:sulfide:quinone oxidoreductase
MKRVVIVGGGTGGTMLANRLSPRRFEVTLISASPEHMFQPSLLYVAFKHKRPNIARDERGLLSRHVHFVQDKVSEIDLAGRAVTTASGKRFDYDYVVLSTGIGTDPGQIPGLDDINRRYGDYHSSVAQAQKVSAALDAFKGGTIALGQAGAICKCPPSPVEGILLIDRMLRDKGLRDKSRLVFFTPYPRAYPAEPINEVVEPIMKARGIEIMPFFDVDKIDTEKRTIESIEGDTIEYDLPIVIPPFVGADIVFKPAEVVDEDRFIKTDKHTLQVAGFDSAFAIGDATNIPTSKAGVEAHLEAQIVAKRLDGADATFDGRTHCSMDLGDGRGTFVIGSFDAPVVKLRPNRLYHLMKLMFGWSYWLSLNGWLDPMIEVYFWLTKPRPRQAAHASKTQQA